ncbi:unnamed protein product [Gordionus sp. m RMFG-2023]|uniref:egl nine homolog 1-like n=1 Tax=Gordionus sp. m RMFG-2023 TaxID=3053472 RepID=UPI0030E22C4F
MSELQELLNYVTNCLNSYGLCVLDNFLGYILAKEVQKEVNSIINLQPFVEGQVLSTNPSIRGDKITWVEGDEKYCYFIRNYIKKVDSIVYECKTDLAKNISGRTKAMISIYPRNGTKYLKHVDNPYKDGRCITTIYYLNNDWDRERDGGCLRLYPSMIDAEPIIEPMFDRLILFWSDSRNPHEVEPSFRTRFAITVWYLDEDEIKTSNQECKYQIIKRE